mmetsp:Transcript_67310/g.161369  ORF Transcript_67310/g.161369 Transcript_67310/m.161369 type:complete len:329 (+) Transcript_67310:63-1049(+)
MAAEQQPSRPQELEETAEAPLPGSVAEEPSDSLSPSLAAGESASQADVKAARHEEVAPPPLAPAPDDDDDEFEEDTEMSSVTNLGGGGLEAWPPRPPLVKFKVQMQFSNRFVPWKHKALIQEANADIDDKVKVISEEMKAPIIAWVNKKFAMNIELSDQLELGFPVVVLTVLDAVYPKRVRWGQVTWSLQYKRSMVKNFNLLHRLWQDVNMDKAREFRVEHTSQRLEDMLDSTLAEKVTFLHTLCRWFGARMSSAGPYDPVRKRVEWVTQCRAAGHKIKLPPWMLLDQEDAYGSQGSQNSARIETEFDKLPEYKRLILFLGSQDHQSM